MRIAIERTSAAVLTLVSLAVICASLSIHSSTLDSRRFTMGATSSSVVEYPRSVAIAK